MGFQWSMTSAMPGQILQGMHYQKSEGGWGRGEVGHFADAPFF